MANVNVDGDVDVDEEEASPKTTFQQLCESGELFDANSLYNIQYGNRPRKDRQKAIQQALVQTCSSLNAAMRPRHMQVLTWLLQVRKEEGGKARQTPAPDWDDACLQALVGAASSGNVLATQFLCQNLHVPPAAMVDGFVASARCRQCSSGTVAAHVYWLFRRCDEEKLQANNREPLRRAFLAACSIGSIAIAKFVLSRGQCLVSTMAQSDIDAAVASAWRSPPFPGNKTDGDSGVALVSLIVQVTGRGPSEVVCRDVACELLDAQTPHNSRILQAVQHVGTDPACTGEVFVRACKWCRADVVRSLWREQRIPTAALVQGIHALVCIHGDVNDVARRALMMCVCKWMPIAAVAGHWIPSGHVWIKNPEFVRG
jgi:hypothetical protein